MGKNTAPLYRFVHEESRQILFSATDIDGFFIDSEAHESGVILAREASLEKSVDKPLLERVEVEVLKFDGKVIGSYYVGQIEVIGSRSQEEAGYDWGLLLNLSGYGIPYPYAREIWPQWATGSPTAPGRWSTYPPEAHQSWLHVVQQVWFTADHRARRYRREAVCEIDGDKIANEYSFHCALGEAVNGPGGYYGSNLDALDDCLRGIRAGDIGFQLVWRGFSESQKRLDSEWLETLLDIFDEFGVEVIRD